MTNESFLKEVSAYYTARLKEFGATPRGVDWNGEASQVNRFEQLMKVSDGKAPVSVAEFGCGYGALVDFLQRRGTDFQYIGFDIADEMIAAARTLHEKAANCRFVTTRAEIGRTDFVVASGLFNVKLANDRDSWKGYIESVLDQFSDVAIRGFSFNMLTSYSDLDRMRDNLYYADPAYYFDYCKRRFSRNVALLHDYDLYEFTIIVRKT